MTLLPKVKLKVLPTFPGEIIGGVGIEATKEHGHVTIDLAFNEFGVISAIPTSPTNYVVTYDLATDQYVMIPSSLLGGTVAGIADTPGDGKVYARQNPGWVETIAKTGGTMTGPLVLNADPATALAAATKQYVDSKAVRASPFALDLRDLMDIKYGKGVWTQRGASPGSGSDIGPAIQDGVVAAKAAGITRGILHIPPGLWMMTTPPADTTLAGWYVIGDGSQASKIVHNGTAHCFGYDTSFGWSGGGIKGIGIFLESGKGHANGCSAIFLFCQAIVGAPPPANPPPSGPSQMEFRDLYISVMDNASYWDHGILCYGLNAPYEPRGSRGVHWENIQIFNCVSYAFHGTILIQHTFVNVGTYTGYRAGSPDFVKTGMDFHILDASAYVYGLDLNVGGNIIVQVPTVADVWINGTRWK
jgi:hypothetical protein